MYYDGDGYLFKQPHNSSDSLQTSNISMLVVNMLRAIRLHATEHRPVMRLMRSLPVRCISNIPHSFPPHTPSLVRDEFLEPLDTRKLEALDIRLTQHRTPACIRDWIAYGTVKGMRVFADAFFRKRYLHRAVTVSHFFILHFYIDVLID
jgi:hypothetical protein